ncbi:hypothetical protein [Marinagarivorans cellulosilyticus]|uniref:Uncharacterized protein n=1 Tax=Marinagarivorans cellulosilyticus TaxID=2721545 RepID=A0AAN2BIU4_9GAMM|nr:hypothetical protein [Marinagarivorans cellulosilyticus]BCD96241.1 hypothetical protein MARGE09_P0440 [Marinagarivorans cellulosilyticus]
MLDQHEDKSKVARLLNIQEPVSEVRLQNQEVFSVPSSSNTWLEQVAISTRVNDSITTLDFRVRDWVKGYARLVESIAYERNARNKYLGIADRALESGILRLEESGESLEEAERIVERYSEKVQELEAYIAQAESQMEMILDEVSAAGYLHQVDGAQLTVFDPSKKGLPFMPPTVHEDGTYLHSTAWEAAKHSLDSQLRRGLLESGDQDYMTKYIDDLEELARLEYVYSDSAGGAPDTIDIESRVRASKAELVRTKDSLKSLSDTSRKIRIYASSNLGASSVKGTKKFGNNSKLVFDKHSIYTSGDMIYSSPAKKVQIFINNKKIDHTLSQLPNLSDQAKTQGARPGGIKITDFRKLLVTAVSEHISPELKKLNDSCERLKGAIFADEALLAETRKNHSAEAAKATQELQDARIQFVKTWSEIGRRIADTQLEMKSVAHNPLTDYVVEHLGGDRENLVIANFASNGLVVDTGEHLPKYLLGRGSTTAAVVFPKPKTPFNSDNGDVLLAVKSPSVVYRLSERPSIQLVEENTVSVAWDGYCLGELTKSFNLGPGEQREISLVKTSKFIEKTDRATKTSQSSRSTTSNSFEEKLKNELSNEKKISQQKKNSSLTKTGRSVVDVDSSSRGRKVTQKASLKGSYFGSSGKASVEDRKTTQDSSKKTNALNLSNELSESSASTQSSTDLARNISEAISKVAQESSEEQRVEVSESNNTSTEINETYSETITLQNPNMGTPINYHLYQVKNIYRTSLALNDAKIVVNTGIEILDGVGLTEKRAISVPEIGRFLSDLFIEVHNGGLDKPCSYIAMLAKDLLDGILRRYQDDYSALQVSPNGMPLDGYLNALDTLSDKDGDINPDRSESDASKAVLDLLAKIPEFVLKPVPMGEAQKHSVNAGAYYMDSELGDMPGTDPYLSRMRQLEIERKEKMNEQSVFFPPVAEEKAPD